MQLIVGLGNVGEEYAATRHNVGFMVALRLADRHGVSVDRPYRIGGRKVALYGDWRERSGPVSGAGSAGAGVAAGRDSVVRLLLPQTMMNLSGEALRDAVKWGAAPADTLIVCDDVNLPLGAIRMRPHGGPGGHHGLISCFEALGTEQVPRLRVGVARPQMPKDLSGFVLGGFGADERALIGETLERAVEGCELWARRGIEAAMNRVNAPD